MQEIFRRRALGAEGEAHAADFLKKRGFRILERNFRTRWGELDLIVERKGAQGPEIFFVEVKTRSSTESVAPNELISKTKQVHLSKAAQHYIAQKNKHDVSAGFAVVFVTFEGKTPRYEWIEDAFPLAWGY